MARVPSVRRRRMTTSWLVGPSGLSMTTTPWRPAGGVRPLTSPSAGAVRPLTSPSAGEVRPLTGPSADRTLDRRSLPEPYAAPVGDAAIEHGLNGRSHF